MVLSLSSVAARFQFEPCSHSWIALHPQPKGVVQFVGGALFGTLPTLSYRYFLKSIFDAGYTVIAMPFRFTLHHWSVAIDLLDEHYTLRAAMIESAIAKGYETAVYLSAANYAWIGHGLGCKYIMLLELLSSPDDVLTHALSAYGEDQSAGRQLQEIRQGLSCLSMRLRLLTKRIQQLTRQEVDYDQPSIIHQTSLLLAPAIADPTLIKPLQLLLSKRLTASPTVEQTHQLIGRSHLFRLTGFLQFARDRKTANTCQRLMQEQPHIRRRLLKGNHLEPIGVQLGRFIVDLNPLDKFIQPLSCRDLEFKSLALLHRLRKMPPSPRQSKCAATARHRLAA